MTLLLVHCRHHEQSVVGQQNDDEIHTIRAHARNLMVLDEQHDSLTATNQLRCHKLILFKTLYHPIGCYCCCETGSACPPQPVVVVESFVHSSTEPNDSHWLLQHKGESKSATVGRPNQPTACFVGPAQSRIGQL